MMLTSHRGVAIAGVAGAPLLLLLVRPPFVEPLAAVLLIATIWVGLIPWYGFLRQSSEARLPFLPLTSLFYIAFFALPPFMLNPAWWSQAGSPPDRYGIAFDRITTFVALLVFLGVTALVAAYYLARPLLRRLSIRYRLPRDISWDRLLFILWVGVSAYVVFLYVPDLRASSSVAQVITPLGFFATGMLFVAWQRGKLRDFEKLAYWAGVIPLQVLIHVYDGLITPIVLLFLFLLTLYWHLSGKVGVVVTLVACFALYIFPVLKLSNAFIVEEATSVVTRVSDKISAVGLAAVLFAEGAEGIERHPLLDSVAGKNVVAPLVRRLSLIVLLQYCVDRTPEQIPYLGGATLKNLLTNPVPRFLWKDKPPEVMGQWFGHKYRILSPDDLRTSVNLPWLVEFYINFGWVGVVLGMAIIGALMALLEHLLLQGATTDVEAVAGWALLFHLFYQESNVSLMLGGLVTRSVLFLGFVWLVLRLFCQSRSEPVTPP